MSRNESAGTQQKYLFAHKYQLNVYKNQLRSHAQNSLSTVYT